VKLDFNRAMAALGTCGTIIGAISWVANGASATVILFYIAVATFGTYIGVWPGIAIAAVISGATSTSEDDDWVLVFPAAGAVAGAIFLMTTTDPSEAGSGGRAYGAILGLLVLASVVYFVSRAQSNKAA
jgi:hypothetical protein